ncbi:hypothetical protein [Azohydromonas lata]|uniref:Uncharacterized protein n=1 Tax=Azohydromonas lata TaxID=45677 RepID=A0ABU5I9J3_9BURK|nr:hypothetical protein [Azohydromonas lata]MDZ5455774.1 hypothetical protein [Azohydromonas lata]
MKPPFQQALPPHAWRCCSCRTNQGHGQQSEVFCAANEALRAVLGTWPLQAVQGGEICAAAWHALAKEAETSACFTNFPTFASRQRCRGITACITKIPGMAFVHQGPACAALAMRNSIGLPAQLGYRTRVLVDARFFTVYKQASIQASNSAGNFFLKINNLRKKKWGFLCARQGFLCAR